MPSTNNAAGRLYIILDVFRKHPDNTALEKAWTNALDSKAKDPLKLALEINRVGELIIEIRRQIYRLDVDHTLYLKPFVSIVQIFGFGFTHQISHVKHFVDDSIMAGLEFCDELLSRKIGEKELDAEKVNEFLDEVNDLIQDIGEVDLPIEFKQMIRVNLTRIRLSVMHYSIHGAKGLDDALNIALGTTWTYNKRNNPEVDEAGKEMVKRYAKVIFFGMSLVADAYTLAQIAAPQIDKFLPLIQ